MSKVLIAADTLTCLMRRDAVHRTHTLPVIDCRIVSSCVSFQVTVMNLLIGVLCEADLAFKWRSFSVPLNDVCSGGVVT